MVYSHAFAHINEKSFSATELQRQLGHKYYEPIWAMLHKLRLAMRNRDENYELSGVIELDEGFFSTETPDDEKHKPLKRGRGSQNKSTELVTAESIPQETSDKKYSKPRKFNYLKMIVIDNLLAKTINPIVKKMSVHHLQLIAINLHPMLV